MTARILALALPLPLLANLGCAPPCTDDGLRQDCNDEEALVTVAVDGSGDEDDDDDDDDGDDDDDDSETAGDDDDDGADDDGTTTGETAADDGDTSTPHESSSDDAPLDDDAGTSTDDGPLDDDGPMEESSSEDDGGDPLADEYESCAMNECVEGTECADITNLEDYDPFCSPQCETDDDCPTVGGGVESWCALIPDGELDPQTCVLVCSYDDDMLGECPGAMECADVPGQTTQIGVCMWP